MNSFQLMAILAVIGIFIAALTKKPAVFVVEGILAAVAALLSIDGLPGVPGTLFQAAMAVLAVYEFGQAGKKAI